MSVESRSTLSSICAFCTQSARHRHKLNGLKTNAARLLDSLGIAYEIREYEVDESDLSAQSVAKKVGLPPEQVFKTLVARGDRHGVCFAVVPAGTRGAQIILAPADYLRATDATLGPIAV